MVEAAFSCQDHGHDNKDLIENAVARLKASGYKVTRPRQKLLEAIAKHHGPFSADDLFTKASQLDLVTIYRTLATFSELGIVVRVDLGDSILRYELVDPEGAHHHHVICRACERIEPLDLCQVESLERRLEEMGYSGLSHRLEFFGLCPKCTKPQG